METPSTFIDRKTPYCKDLCVPNLIYKLNTISTIIPASYFMEIDKLIFRFLGRDRKTQNNQHFMGERGLTPLIKDLA